MKKLFNNYFNFDDNDGNITISCDKKAFFAKIDLLDSKNKDIMLDPNVKIPSNWLSMFKNFNHLENDSKEYKKVQKKLEKLLPIISEPLLTEDLLINDKIMNDSFSIRNIEENEGNSFFISIGYLYIEKLITQKNGLDELYNLFLHFFKENGFYFINPNISNTIDHLNITEICQELQEVFINELIYFAKKIIKHENKKERNVDEKDEKLIRKQTKSKNINSLFKLFKKKIYMNNALNLFMRTLVYDECENNSQIGNGKIIQKNVMNLESKVNDDLKEIICKILNIRLKILNCGKNNEIIKETYNKDTYLSISLFYNNGKYNPSYQEKFSKTYFKHLNKKCSKCNHPDNELYLSNECEHKFCKNCIKILLKENSNRNLVKCNICKSVIENINNLKSFIE